VIGARGDILGLFDLNLDGDLLADSSRRIAAGWSYSWIV